jgi:hypothetical protein
VVVVVAGSGLVVEVGMTVVVVGMKIGNVVVVPECAAVVEVVTLGRVEVVDVERSCRWRLMLPFPKHPERAKTHRKLTNPLET